MTRMLTPLVGAVALLFSVSAQAQESLQPFVMAEVQRGAELSTSISSAKKALEAADFRVLGEYSPTDDGHVVVVTNDALMSAATKNKYGGYGAVVRVALTDVGDGVQVSFTDPRYFSAAYRVGTSNKPTYGALKTALGAKRGFGAKAGLSAEEIRNYRYTAAAPGFSDQVKLGTFQSHTEAVDSVVAGLAMRQGGTQQVYRLDLDGKDVALFGVGLTTGKGADAIVLEVANVKEAKKTAYAPFELLVVDNTVYTMAPKFRLSVNFPDLDMGTFVRMSTAPDAIQASLKAATGK